MWFHEIVTYMNQEIGKEFEHKIKLWLDRPESGYSFDRFYDQMTGFYQTSRNICDFHLYKYPNDYYIECKATYKDRFDFSMIRENQMNGLLKKSNIPGVHGWVLVLFADQKRTFRLDIRDIQKSIQQDIHSINIKKIDKWEIPYKEIQTIPNSRKKLLDYNGDIEDLL